MPIKTKEERAAYAREWCRKNPLKVIARNKKYYAKNAEAEKTRTAKYRADNPDVVKVQAARQIELYRNDPEYREQVSQWGKKSRGRCKPRIQAYEKMRGQKNKEKIAEYQKQYQKENREAINKTALAGKHRRKAADPEGYAAMRRAEDKAWHDKNPGKGAAKATAYRATKLQRAAAWADQEAINFFYECCPEGLEIDHIIPLRGELISGLHIETNLQWLTREQNRVKSNHWPRI